MADPSYGCFDFDLEEYGSCEDHFDDGAYFTVYECTGPDLETCGSAATGYDGTYVNHTLVCNIYGCKYSGAHTASDPWVFGGTGAPGGGGEGESFLPELSLEDGGLLAAAIAGIWALGLCLRLIRKQLEDS